MPSLFCPAPLAIAVFTADCSTNNTVANTQPTAQNAVVAHYADVAHATFEDALITARTLDAATDRLIANPTGATLALPLTLLPATSVTWAASS